MEKSCLTSVMAFDNEMAGSVAVGRTVDAACLDFGKAFDTVSHNRQTVEIQTRETDNEVD